MTRVALIAEKSNPQPNVEKRMEQS
ncbi:hypothetical protein [Pedobacter sp. UYP30]